MPETASSLAPAQTYYGEVLQSSDDLQTNACRTDDAMPGYLKDAVSRLHDEVLARYYGCGLVHPEVLEGATVLDLGCGAGRDVYTLAQLVGPSGHVHGVDFTPAQLDVARRHEAWHAERFGYATSNVTFHEGRLEELGTLGLAPGGIDVIVSNCVLNLVRDKEAVLRAAFDLLRPGGEIYFADVYADRRLDPALFDDPVLHGECLSGALYWNDFHNIAKRAGFGDPRLVRDRRIAVENPDLEARLGNTRFFSATYRLMKIDGLESHCEDYGQAVIYRGGISHHDDVFLLDAHHAIEKGRVFPVCGNTWRMLAQSRFAPYFEFIGDFSKHFGIFKGCGVDAPFASASGATGDASAAACC